MIKTSSTLKTFEANHVFSQSIIIVMQYKTSFTEANFLLGRRMHVTMDTSLEHIKLLRASEVNKEDVMASRQSEINYTDKLSELWRKKSLYIV